MNRRAWIPNSMVLLLALGGALQAAQAADSKALELFGVSLKGATRAQLRQAFRANGLKVTRESDQYWVDQYDAKDVLSGASEFQAGYTSNGNFAFAQYTFKSFVDPEMVGKVVNMVASKYGRPASQSGDFGLGNVKVRWRFAQGMDIEVTRGWPDTTTYLTYIDWANKQQMESEVEAEQKRQESQKNKTQNRAF